MKRWIVRSRSIAPRPRAMTLVELLVVMSIIVILVSAVVVAVFRISGKAPVEGTKGLLAKLSVGLEAYRATYRMYPPQDNVADPISPAPDYPALDLPSSITSVQASTFVLWSALEYYGQGQFMTPVSGAYKGQGGTFTDPTTGAQQPWYYYQDAWKQPILYVCNSPYNQYQLTSAGPDLVLFTADDIKKP
jgi:prepilin-type N-terminal cleavage/methylation domain-containing protein